MEMLETALKQSISQCLQDKPLAATTKQQNKHIPGLADAIELRLREESQSRAFISQFKIELNNLIGLKWTKASGNESACGCEDESEDEETGHLLSQIFEDTETSKAPGMIELNCKHSGLYKINAQLNKQKTDSIMDSIETEVDDGYRSMNQCNFKNSLIHQVNEIKSRLIDLVHEIDEKVESRLSDVELDCYRRRRNILIEKLDLLLDTLSSRTSDTSQFSLPNSTVSSDSRASSQLNHKQSTPINGKKSSNGFNKQLLTSNYEEQEHIINYSDSSHSSLEDNCTGVLGQVEDGPLYGRSTAVATVVNKHPINHHSLKKRSMKHSPVNNQQHMPSSSTTSTYSTSSHTSSSSFL